MSFQIRVSMTMHSMGFFLLGAFFGLEEHKALGELAWKFAFLVLAYAWIIEPILSKFVIGRKGD
jgi:hypothetical protein